MEFEWKSEDRLCTRAVRPAVVKHPVTGEMTWFNQAQHWHISCLDPQTRESMVSLFAEDDLPRNCYYGDGSRIEDSVMNEILSVYQDLEVSFPWQKGDILMLNNLLTAHARNQFVGPRQIMVARRRSLSGLRRRSLRICSRTTASIHENLSAETFTLRPSILPSRRSSGTTKTLSIISGPRRSGSAVYNRLSGAMFHQLHRV